MTRMTDARRRGLVDTNILILRDLLNPADLPDKIAISAVTLAELSAGPHAVVGDDPSARAERGRRMAILQRADSEFEPLAFDAPGCTGLRPVERCSPGARSYAEASSCRHSNCRHGGKQRIAALHHEPR